MEKHIKRVRARTNSSAADTSIFQQSAETQQASSGPDHALPEDRTRPQGGQQRHNKHQMDQITHILKAEKGHKQVSRGTTSIKWTRSRTLCRQNKATSRSVEAKQASNEPD